MLDAIMNRRSIRKYRPDPITDDQIRALLTAAMMAPSARNGQPWHFVVCRDRAVLDALRASHPYAEMLKEAPLCIAVCAEEGEVRGYYQQDCAAATQNLLLAAAEMGLGTCWMGVAPRPERMEPVARTLNLPPHVKPFNLIAVGHPAEVRPRPERYRADRIHFDRW